MPRRGIAGYSGSTMSNFLRNHQTDFQSGCTSLQSHQQWRSVPLSPHSSQHLLSPEFLMLAILTGVRCNLRVVWYAFSWWLRMLNNFSGASLPFGICQVRILYLALSPTFFLFIYYVFSSMTFPMLFQKSPIPFPHFPTHPFSFFWPWRSHVLGHIKFVCPMGLSFQWWPSRPSFDTYIARVKSSRVLVSL